MLWNNASKPKAWQIFINSRFQKISFADLMKSQAFDKFGNIVKEEPKKAQPKPEPKEPEVLIDVPEEEETIRNKIDRINLKLK